MSEQPQSERKSPRLKGYDYTKAGAYFVTICTYQRVHLFGDVVNGEMCLSDMGRIANDLWPTIAEHRSNVELDAFVVMPNHVHGILTIFDSSKSEVGRRRASASDPKLSAAQGTAAGALSTIIGAYKAAVTRRINQVMGLTAPLVWQYRFHDHIIRSEQSLNFIRDYVYNNPTKWAEDWFYQA